jgi:hypothetical protein
MYIGQRHVTDTAGVPCTDYGVEGLITVITTETSSCYIFGGVLDLSSFYHVLQHMPTLRDAPYLGPVYIRYLKVYKKITTAKTCKMATLPRQNNYPAGLNALLDNIILLTRLLTYMNEQSRYKSYWCYKNLHNFYGSWVMWLGKLNFTQCIPNQRDSVSHVYCHITAKISATFFYSEYLEVMLVNVHLSNI